MIHVTDVAKKELDAFFADKEKGTIRVFLAPGGCSGPRLSVALDDAKDGDKTFESAGYDFCIEENLLDQVKSVTIDLTYTGFVISPEVPLPYAGGCSGCGGSCGH